MALHFGRLKLVHWKIIQLFSRGRTSTLNDCLIRYGICGGIEVGLCCLVTPRRRDVALIIQTASPRISLSLSLQLWHGAGRGNMFFCGNKCRHSCVTWRKHTRREISSGMWARGSLALRSTEGNRARAATDIAKRQRRSLPISLNEGEKRTQYVISLRPKPENPTLTSIVSLPSQHKNLLLEQALQLAVNIFKNI